MGYIYTKRKKNYERKKKRKKIERKRKKSRNNMASLISGPWLLE